ARRLVDAAGLADLRHVVVDQAVAVVVDGVADLGARTDEPDALAAACLRALLALAPAALDEARRPTPRPAPRPRAATAPDAVAVVVDAVADLGLRIVAARLEATARDAGAGVGDGLRRLARHRARAVGRRRQTARYGGDAVVGEAVAVVVATVADLGCGNAR